MDDLDEFMDDEETKSLMTVHEEKFEEVVDIIAQEQRERGEQIVEYQEKGLTMAEVEETMSETGSEVLDENGKPFWMKFFKADYLADEEPPVKQSAKNQTMGKKEQTQKERVTETLLQKEKIRREYEKIRKLDAELAHKTKFQRDHKNAMMARKQQEESEQQQIIMLEKKQKQKEKEAAEQKKGKKPPSSSKPIRKESNA